MLTHLPSLLGADELTYFRESLARADWADGRITAGHQSALAKRNQQLPADSRVGIELGARVIRALNQNPRFGAAALPKAIFPPLFNRYEAGMRFGSHVDNALRVLPDGTRLRTDLSATLFLSDPASYEGGELVIEDSYGAHEVKLPAGDLVLYPASSLHHVAEVTRGVRLACFFWVESVVRDDGQRALLSDLDAATSALAEKEPGSAPLVMLTGVYNNLLRRWAEP